jgi:hypothetical protein
MPASLVMKREGVTNGERDSETSYRFALGWTLSLNWPCGISGFHLTVRLLAVKCRFCRTRYPCLVPTCRAACLRDHRSPSHLGMVASWQRGVGAGDGCLRLSSSSSLAGYCCSFFTRPPDVSECERRGGNTSRRHLRLQKPAGVRVGDKETRHPH